MRLVPYQQYWPLHAHRKCCTDASLKGYCIICWCGVIQILSTPFLLIQHLTNNIMSNFIPPTARSASERAKFDQLCHWICGRPQAFCGHNIQANPAKVEWNRPTTFEPIQLKWNRRTQRPVLSVRDGKVWSILNQIRSCLYSPAMSLQHWPKLKMTLLSAAQKIVKLISKPLWNWSWSSIISKYLMYTWLCFEAGGREDTVMKMDVYCTYTY